MLQNYFLVIKAITAGFLTGEMGCPGTEFTVIPYGFRLASKAFAKFIAIVSSLALFM
jgi:hypothetical protein